MVPADRDALLAAYGGYAPGKTRISFIGPHQQARRFIHAPSFAWSAVPRATQYRVVFWSGPAPVLDVTATDPAVTPEQAWERIPYGRVRMLVLALDSTGSLVGYSNTRS